MRRDSKLSGILHVLLHLTKDTPLTSEGLAKMMDTNPVVIRRLLGSLRERGLVSSGKGHGGGWTLSRELGKITLGDVYRALGSPALFVFEHRSMNPSCLVEKAVNSALDDARVTAEAVLLKRFDEVTLAVLSEKLHKKHLTHGA